MHKIDGAGSVSGAFVPGDPGTGTPATVVTADWANAVQQEIVNVVEYTGAALSKPDNTQLLTAIQAIVASATAAVPVGTSLVWNFSSAPAGFLLEDGKTIGNATSGATSRANADTITLYTGLWNSWNNTVLPIQDSGGSPTTRGATAADDFAAGKRLPLPDSRGRVTIGKDDMGGTAASRVTTAISGLDGATLGATGGDERLHQHTHTASVTDPGHGHAVYSDSLGASGSTIGGLGLAGIESVCGMLPSGSQSYYTNAAGGDQIIQNSTTGVTVSNTNAGAGSSQNVQPGIVKNMIIKY